MLNKGCVGYLESMVEVPKKEAKISLVQVVSKFENVFPKDLLGLPPDREIKFAIDLVLGTAPISKTPYCMAPQS